MERAKGQIFLNEPRAAAANDAFLLQSEPSPTLPASAIQQGNQRKEDCYFLKYQTTNWFINIYKYFYGYLKYIL